MKSNFMRSATVALTLAASLPFVEAARAQSGPRVTVDQQVVNFTGQPAVEQNGRVLVPLRGVLEKLGAYVQYDNETRTVIALKNNLRIALPLGSRSATVNDRTVSLDAPAQSVNGTTLVPLRFVAESLGAGVTYDAGTRTVAIVSRGGTAPTAPGGTYVPTAPASAPTATVTGTVVTVYPNLNPPRLVVRTGRASDRTIPLQSGAAVTVRRPNGATVPITIARVQVGDRVQVEQTGDGAARSILVTRRGNNAPGSNNNNTTTATVFRGEYLNSSPATSGGTVLKMTDGRLIEVADNVAVFYENKRASLGDLRSGDKLTVTVNPRTKRGTRVTVDN